MKSSKKENLIKALFKFFASKGFEKEVTIMADKARYEWKEGAIKEAPIPFSVKASNNHVLSMIVDGSLLMYMRSSEKDEIYSIYEKYGVDEYRIETEVYSLFEC